MADLSHDLFVGGVRLTSIQAALSASAVTSPVQSATTTAGFWSTPPRSPETTVRDVFEVRLQSRQPINVINIELARFPHEAHFFLLDQAGQWQEILLPNGSPVVITNLDALPEIIYPMSAVQTGHPQHYGAGHWVRHTLAIRPVRTSVIRVVLARIATSAGPRDQQGNQVDYSLGVRNFSAGYQIHDLADVPYEPRSSTSLNDRTSFASTTDLLGSSVALSLRETQANNLLTSGVWRSEVQPLASAVVNLYVDARDTYGQPQVVDRFFLNPLTSGVRMNIYSTTETPTRTIATSGDQIVPTVDVLGTQAVLSDGDGLLFPAFPAFLDIANSGVHFDLLQPFWLALVIQPQFASDDVTQRVFFDNGVLLLGWNGTSFYVQMYGLIVTAVSPAIFSPNQRCGLAIDFDGDTLRLYTNDGQLTSGDLAGDAPASIAAVVGAGLAPVIRIGGDVNDPTLTSAIRLRSLVLKAQSPQNPQVYEAYFADPTGFAVDPGGIPQAITTGSAILRYDPIFATGAPLAPYGFVGGSVLDFEACRWTPVNRDYVLARGYADIPQTTASYFKFEFYRLSAVTYDGFTTSIVDVRLFPSDVTRTGQAPLKESGNTASGGSPAAQGIASSTYFADQARLYTTGRTDEPNEDYTPTKALYSTNQSVAERLRLQSIYYSLQPWHPTTHLLRFAHTRRHSYEHRRMAFTGRVGYWVGLSGLSMYRVDYTAAHDTERYVESFRDDVHLASMDWSLDLVHGLIHTPDSVVSANTYTTTSKVLASTRKVVGLQFATQQTPPTQILPDPGFDDLGLAHWKPSGAAVLSRDADAVVNQIGTMLKVSKASVDNFWSVVEQRFPTWDSIEVGGTTWAQMQFGGTTVASGGVAAVETYSMPSQGRVYAAARVYAPRALSAPLFVQILDANERVLSEEPVTVPGGQIVEWFTAYTIGENPDFTRLTWDQIESTAPSWTNMEERGLWDQVDLGFTVYDTDLTVRLVQPEATLDTWYVDDLSLFLNPIVWQFSNDAGNTFSRVWDIRNNPHGMFLFPPSSDLSAGKGLVWSVSSSRSRQHVNSLAIRPVYEGEMLGRPYRETIETSGPNVSAIDHYSAVHHDPFWRHRLSPIPESWFYTSRQWFSQQSSNQQPDNGIIVLPDVVVGTDQT